MKGNNSEIIKERTENQFIRNCDKKSNFSENISKMPEYLELSKRSLKVSLLELLAYKAATTERAMCVPLVAGARK